MSSTTAALVLYTTFARYTACPLMYATANRKESKEQTCHIARNNHSATNITNGYRIKAWNHSISDNRNTSQIWQRILSTAEINEWVNTHATTRTSQTDNKQIA